MIQSLFRPPVVCRSCEEVGPCERIHWPFADHEGTACPRHTSSQVLAMPEANALNEGAVQAV